MASTPRDDRQLTSDEHVASSRDHVERLAEILAPRHERMLTAATLAEDDVPTEAFSLSADMDASLAAEIEGLDDCLRRVERARRESILHAAPSRSSSESEHAETFSAWKDGAQDATRQRMGRFEIVRELGRGGLGVVSLAYDPVLKRQVALKLPRPEALLTDQLRQRFQHEAHAAARLTHPHIVPVYEVGTVGPICFIATAYIEGQSLSEWLKSAPGLMPPREAAELVAQLAEAMQYAHEQGVLHRDLKPGNILLERRALPDGAADASVSGRSESPRWDPKITDFGLAKLMDLAGDETRSGVILGTPAYMSPEQAGGGKTKLGPESDVYSLGAILYELLTGRPPFRGDSDTETLYKLVAEEPLAPRLLNREAPPDLAAIALKCLEKQPSRRYPSAGTLAADLRRFMSGEATQARPLSALGQTRRWMGRNRRVAALLSLVAFLLITVAVVSALAAWRIEDARREALAAAAQSRQLEQSERKARQATDQSYQELAEREKELWRIAYASNSRKACEMFAQRQFDAAANFLERNRPGPGREDLRGFEWYFLWNMIHQQNCSRLETGDGTLCVQFSQNQRWLAAGTKQGVVLIWDADTLEPVHRWQAHSVCVNQTVFSADGTLLATCGCDGLARVWRVGTWEQVSPDLPHSQAWVGGADFMPDGHVLITSTGTQRGSADHAEITLWDWATGTALHKFDGGEGGIGVVRVALDGTRLVAVNTRGLLLQWELGDGNPPKPIDHLLNSETPAIGTIPSLDLSADGRRVAYFGPNHDISVVDLEANGDRRLIRMKWSEDRLALSPDGRAIALQRGTISAENGALLESDVGEAGYVEFLDFSPTGERIAVAANDHFVRVIARDSADRPVRRIDLAGITKNVPRGFALPVGDETWVISGVDGLWAIDRSSLSRRKLDVSLPAGTDVVCEAATLRGDYLIVRDLTSDVRRWLLSWPDHQGPCRVIHEFVTEDVLLFSADGGTFVRYFDGHYELCSTQDGSVRQRYRAPVAHATLWPDGSALETVTPEGSYRIDLATGVIRPSGSGAWHAWPVDNGKAMFKTDYMTAWVEDAQTGQRLHELRDGTNLALSPDGKRVVIRLQSGQINLYDVMTGYDLGTIFDARTAITWAHFTSDGRRLSLYTSQQPDEAKAIYELTAADPQWTELSPGKAAAH